MCAWMTKRWVDWRRWSIASHELSCVLTLIAAITPPGELTSRRYGFAHRPVLQDIAKILISYEKPWRE